MSEKSREEINMLVQKIDLNGERSDQPQFYIAKHEAVSYASNGKEKRVDMYTLHMMCEPDDRSVGEADKYTLRARAHKF